MRTGKKKRGERENAEKGKNAKVANVCMINRSQLRKYVSYTRRRSKCMYNCAHVREGERERNAGNEQPEGERDRNAGK